MLESRSSMGVLTLTLLLVTVAVIGSVRRDGELSVATAQGAGHLTLQMDKLNEPVFRLQSTQAWLMRTKSGRTATQGRSVQFHDTLSEAFQTHPFTNTMEAAFCEWNDKPFGTPHQTLIALRSKPREIEEPRFHNGAQVFQFGGAYFVR